MKPVDGLNVFAMSLGDVLYDPETQRYYVTNTGKQVDMQSINPGAETEEPGNPEERYNHNHGSDGRFTFGVDKGSKHDKIKKTKYAPSPQRQHRGVQVKHSEYSLVCSELMTHYPYAEAGDIKHIHHERYVYSVEADGYGGCIIIGKHKLC